MKKAFWLVGLFVVLAVVLYMLRSRETFAGPCQYSAAMPNTYVAGCSAGCKTFPNLQDAQTACSAEPTCGGVTQRPGQQVFELRAGPASGTSPTGETSWICTSPAQASSPAMYDNGKTYRPGDTILYDGVQWKMTEFIGAAGYTPSAYPKNWQRVDTPVPTPVTPYTPNLPVAPTSSATPMAGTPAVVPIPQAPPTVVLPYNTAPGTYLLRQVT